MVSGAAGFNQPIYLKNQPLEGMNQNRGDMVCNPEEFYNVMARQLRREKQVPYEYLAKDGMIDYNGVQFVCDPKNNRLCMGDVSNPKNCLFVSLENGGCLVANHDCIGDLSKAISMFSPEDQKRIMYAISMYQKAEELEKEIEEDTESIGESAEE